MLNVTIHGFYSRFDGKAIIRQRVDGEPSEVTVQIAFQPSTLAGQNSYDALMCTLAQGWQQETYAIAL